ncbi:MAG: DNA polymerase III subunit alpha [Gemmatimonadales bacterium]|jgi:error-prone DNA polymerase
MYVELHCHSAFSFLDGASLPEQLLLQAHSLGYHSLALTDHNGLYGSMAFAQAAKQMGIQAITGAEMTLLDGSHVTLLAETPDGYANLCRLITESHLKQEDRHSPKLDFASLERLHGGIIILSGCRRGLLATVFRNEGLNAARRLAEHCCALFGRDHFFLELQRNRVRGDRALSSAFCDMAQVTGLQVVATGNVHYHRQERHRLHDALVAIRHRTTLDASHDMRRANNQFYLRPPGEVAKLFADRPDALANTVAIAERCASFDLTKDLGYTFPDFRGSRQTTAPRALAELSHTKLDELYPPGSRYRADAEARLEKELALIERHGLGGFFLVYRDLLELAREVALDVREGSRRITSNLLPGRGRGSSVSSIVCYFLGLSHIDPVANRLFLGRFLNESLASIPDIDLDFPREIREELIRRVYQRYGSEHVGLVCSFPTYHLRSAVRELGRALDLPQGELEQIARLAGHQTATGLRDELNRLPTFADKADAPLWRELCNLAEEIAGLPRHISQHVGGMIISSRPLVEIVPLERAAMPDRVICQWDKDSCDDARFIKIDFLALGMLSLVEECVELIAQRNNEPPDLSRIDFHDDTVYDQICSGDTVGTFQIESRAQIQMIRRTRPRNLDDLAVEVAIVRPGPIVGGAVNPFVRRREQQRAALSRNRNYDPPVDHPLLREALAETLGVIIYQDQVLQVCQALAGFSAGQAEALRRAMSRRRSRELMQGFWEQFRNGAARLGVRETIAQRVFDQVVAFSEFGFPKSHAAAFGLLAYQSAWLRHYYPIEYYTALFNNQPMGFYSLDTLGRDAARHNVEVKLPDVNRSDVDCSVEEDAVRVGLGFLREWGLDVAEAVVAERERNGPYVSLADIVRRAPPRLSRDAIENLVWVGGCDSFGLTRRELLWQVGLWLPPKTDRTSRNRARRQLELPLNHPYEDRRFADVPAEQRLVAEYQVLGFAPGAHPFTLLADSLPPGIERSDQLDRLEHDTEIQVAGLVVARQRPGTAKGFTFILLEDQAGMINAIVRPDVYDRDRIVIRREPFLWIAGRIAKDDGTINVIAQEVRPLRLCKIPPQPTRPAPRSPYSLLKELRRTAPGSKDWG